MYNINNILNNLSFFLLKKPKIKINDNSNIIMEENNISSQEKETLIPESNKEESEDKLKDEYIKNTNIFI